MFSHTCTDMCTGHISMSRTLNERKNQSVTH